MRLFKVRMDGQALDYRILGWTSCRGCYWVMILGWTSYLYNN
ncbi:hypothetical protein [Clostridium paraputrificum]